MPSTSRRGHLAGAAITGLVAAAWYAMPDHLPRRSQRFPAKIALLAGGGAIYAWLAPGGAREDREDGTVPLPGRTDTPPDDERATTDEEQEVATRLGATLGRLSPRGVAGIVVGGLSLTAATAVLQERLIHRFGERLGRRGVTLPHTRIGLVLGAVAALSGASTPERAARPGRDARHRGD